MYLPRQQGDQIGRNFAFWVIVFIVHFLNVAEVAHFGGLPFFHGKSYVMGYILGDYLFF
jgi:hypothetical protein